MTGAISSGWQASAAQSRTPKLKSGLSQKHFGSSWPLTKGQPRDGPWAIMLLMQICCWKDGQSEAQFSRARGAWGPHPAHGEVGDALRHGGTRGEGSNGDVSHVGEGDAAVSCSEWYGDSTEWGCEDWRWDSSSWLGLFCGRSVAWQSPRDRRRKVAASVNSSDIPRS